jgi:tetratricopeptide (TPR) repeat protein
METTKIGRNDPCRCGSGKKYKRCCLPADEAPAVERARATAEREAAFVLHSAEINARLRRRGLGRSEDALRSIIAELKNEMYELDRLSHHAADLIHAGRFDEATEACDRLERDHPDEVDAFELRALLHEVRGDTTIAAALYRRALEFTLSREHYDDELRDSYREHIARLDAQLAKSDASP